MTVKRIKNRLDSHIQGVRVNGSMSKWKQIKSGVPEGSMLQAILFNIFINDKKGTDLFMIMKNGQRAGIPVL